MPDEHWCAEHGKVWFKRGSMRGYAHPIEDEGGQTVGWCNEDAKEVAKLPPQSSHKVLQKHQEVIEEAKQSVSFDPTRKSIERQTSLKAATDWCVAQFQGGRDIKTIELITVAGLFESYLENGLQVKKKVD